MVDELDLDITKDQQERLMQLMGWMISGCKHSFTQNLLSYKGRPNMTSTLRRGPFTKDIWHFFMTPGSRISKENS